MTSHLHRMNCQQSTHLVGRDGNERFPIRSFLVVTAIFFLQFAAVTLAQTTIRDADGAARAKAASTRTERAQNATTSAAGSTAIDGDLGRDWVRLQYGDDGKPLAMQTAIVRYVSKQATASPSAPAVAVDLIGAVHVGDVAYYRQLNEQFKKYDALLYELVAPEGTVVERGRGTSSAHPIGALQNGIKTLLELDHQLEEIDYTRPNFVHADMSPDQFLQAMKDRNESFLQMYFRLLGHAMAHQSELSANGQSLDFELFSALFAKDRPRRLKAALAKQLAEMESLLVSFGGEQGSVIITERNKMALKVLKQQLDAGKKQLGIFYGAGHLNDMDQRLRKDFGLEPVSITWLTAWNLAVKR
jgi:hypothetical protein